MNPVLKSAQFVVENSRHVKINKDKINEFAKTFTNEHIKHWLNEAPFDFAELNDSQKLNFALLFNALSFSYWGSPKWNVKYKGEISDGSFGMITALRRAIEEGKPILNPEYLSKLTKQEASEILRGTAEIPLLEERWKILNEMGAVLVKKYNSSFGNVLKEADYGAAKLIQIIAKDFPSFDDVQTFKGRKIFFYKRAQLLLWDISQIFDSKGYGAIEGIKELTACADYKLPQILRKLGILSYCKELAEKIDNKIQIQKNSEEEIEMRANTIQAVELIKKEVQKKVPDITAMHINDHIWLESQKKSQNDKPYHLTRTTAY